MPLEHVSVPFPLLRDIWIGDIVTVESVGPLHLQGTVSFNVLKITKAAGTRNSFRSSETGPTHYSKQLFSQMVIISIKFPK